MMNTVSLRKKLVTGGATIFGLFFIVYFVILNSYISVSFLSGKSPNNMTVAYIDNKGDVIPARSALGVSMVPRSTSSVVIRAGDTETRVFTPEKAIAGITYLKVEMSSQKKLSKLGSDGLSCNSAATDKRIFTYDCYGGNNTIYTYGNKKLGQFENQPLPTSLNPNQITTQPYSNGTLALVNLTSSVVVEYTDIFTGNTDQLSLPYTDEDSLNLFADTSSDSFLVVNNTTHEALYYESLQSKRKKVALQNEFTYTTCGIYKKAFSCSATKSAESEEQSSHSAENEEAAKSARIVTYDVTSGKWTQSDVNDQIEHICNTKDGTYIREKGDVLRFSPIKQAKYYALASNISELSCDDDSVVFSDGKSIYRTQAGSSRLLFQENRLSVSALQSIRGEIVASLIIADETDPTLHTYIVTNTALEGPRPEKTLPYSNSGDLPIFAIDYDDDTIYIKPHMSVTSDRSTGTTTVDEVALTKTKQQIENKLREDGLIDKYKLVYHLN